MIQIKQIDWLDKETKEAFIKITDGENEAYVFSYPFKGSKKLEEEPFHIFEPRIILKTEEPPKISILGEKGEHCLQGKLINLKKGLIQIGEFIFKIDPFLLPGDIKEGDNVKVICERIDWY